MRKILLSILGLVFLFACSKDDVPKQADLMPAYTLKAGAAGIKGVNWADARDNYNSGWVLPTGVSASNSYSTIKSHAQTICSQFVSKLGANTVRIPINPPTVAQFWSNYKGTIDGARAAGMKVIICCWTASNTIGYVTDWTAFLNMWATVTNSYGGDSSVYFEILNEPYSYSTNDLLNMYSSWLSSFSSIPRSRVLCGGTGYCDNVSNIGGDSRISGCLLSQHIYPFWATHNVSGWMQDLSGRIGSYASRTVVTEFGCPQNTGLQFYGTSSSDNNVCFFQGIANQCRGYGISCCYWPGLRDGDGYSMTTLNYSTYALTIVNSTGVQELKYAYN